MSFTNHRKMQLYGALLLLPAAILLATFAYLPTIATVINSLFLPGFRGAPTEFVGLENYQVLFDVLESSSQQLNLRRRYDSDFYRTGIVHGVIC